MHSHISRANSSHSHYLPWLSTFQAKKSRLKAINNESIPRTKNLMHRMMYMHTHTHTACSYSHVNIHRTGGSMQSNCRFSQLICQESFGSNYCRPRQLLLPCVSESSPHSESHSITLFTNGHAVNEGLAPHHIPVIASVVFIHTLSDGTRCKLFNCGHMQQERGSCRTALRVGPSRESSPSLLMFDDCALPHDVLSRLVPLVLFCLFAL